MLLEKSERVRVLEAQITRFMDEHIYPNEARFYRAISRKTRTWMSRERNPTHWVAADALAMVAALSPEGALQWQERALKVELDGTLTRGATVVDWSGRMGWPVNARILMRYDQAGFGKAIQAALGCNSV